MLSFMFKKGKVFFAFVQFCTFISWMIVISRKIARRVERVRRIDAKMSVFFKAADDLFFSGFQFIFEFCQLFFC